MRDLAVNSQLEYRSTELANVRYALYSTLRSFLHVTPSHFLCPAV
jgi:hypothetical protein